MSKKKDNGMIRRNGRAWLTERRNKRIYCLYHRYMEIRREVRRKYKVNVIFYSFDEPIDAEDFLGRRDEARHIHDEIYGQEYNRLLKYVHGGGTYFYTPMKKKERRKNLRKFRQLPLGHFIEIYEEEKQFLPSAQHSCATPASCPYSKVF